MIKVFKVAALATVAVVALGVSSASAMMIDGEISFTSPSFTPTGGTGLGNATGFDFVTNIATAQACAGDLLTGGACAAGLGTIEDFDFSPLGSLGGGGVGPIADFWTIGIFNFDLEAVNILFQSGMALFLEGTGTMSATGFDDTPGNFMFTTQTAGDRTFSASFSSATIPEPATLGLVGLGFVGLGVAARRRQVH